jgi:hypothetical protein
MLYALYTKNLPQYNFCCLKVQSTVSVNFLVVILLLELNETCYLWVVYLYSILL